LKNSGQKAKTQADAILIRNIIGLAGRPMMTEKYVKEKT